MSKRKSSTEPSAEAKKTSAENLRIERERLALEKKTFQQNRKASKLERKQLRAQSAQNNLQLSLLQRQVDATDQAAAEYSDQLNASAVLATEQQKQTENEALRTSLLQQVQSERAATQGMTLLRRTAQRRSLLKTRLAA